MATRARDSSTSGRGPHVRFDEDAVQAIFQDVDGCHAPGVAVGISIHGKPVYRRGFGLASMELPVVLSTTTRMRIGSTSKQFTCLLYLLLCEEGRARIDDQLGKYLPEVHPFVRQVTMRQLMGNTNGLRDAWHLVWQFNGLCAAPVASVDLLSFYLDAVEGHFIPGTGWSYNNAGYELIALAVERLTGRPFAEVLRERVFEPIGMHDTALRTWERDIIFNVATPHVKDVHGRFERVPWGISPLGAGAVVSTADDMLRWLAHMDSPTVGSPSTWAEMRAPQRLSHGAVVPFGLSLFLDRFRGIEALCAPGGWLGANAQMVKVPSAGLDVIVMANRHDVSSSLLAERVLETCLSLEVADERRSACLPSGTFCSPTTGRVVELIDREGQMVALVDGREFQVRFGEDGSIRPKSWYSAVHLDFSIIGDLERPAALRFNDFGCTDELVRVNAEPFREADPSSICGRYLSDEATGTEVKIQTVDGVASLKFAGKFGSVIYDEVEGFAERTWKARCSSELERWLGGTGIMSFGDQGFRFNAYGTLGARGVYFRRIE